MNPAVEAIVRAVLYEGYILYPYRPSAIKNRHRWSPGGLVPRVCSEANGGVEPWLFQAECLVACSDGAALSVRVRFLYPLLRTSGELPPSQEATEREVTLPSFPLNAPESQTLTFSFPASCTTDSTGERTQHAIEGTVEISATLLDEYLFRVTIRVGNNTPLDSNLATDRAQIELRSLASAHAVLAIHNGEFVSLTDPPAHLRLHAAACRNLGVWPVLVGDPGSRETLFASPIILPDYPQIAPESSGDFFDGTEIDEMLALRVLTLTDAEKHEMAADPRSSAILEWVESLSEDAMLGLHGAVRSRRSPVGPRVGDRVRLRPRGRADAFDLLLAGKAATVVSVEVDFEDTTYLTVTVNDDPGQDLGAGGMPGHRFFFRQDEVEPL